MKRTELDPRSLPKVVSEKATKDFAARGVNSRREGDRTFHGHQPDY